LYSGTSWPFALYLDASAKRCRLWLTMAWNQIDILATHPVWRKAFQRLNQQTRTWYLATSLLGTHNTWWTRPGTTHRLHSLQYRKTWACDLYCWLALFFVSPFCSTRSLYIEVGIGK
jgi:hypothetical protein